jgi:hypothetical protein
MINGFMLLQPYNALLRQGLDQIVITGHRYYVEELHAVLVGLHKVFVFLRGFWNFGTLELSFL